MKHVKGLLRSVVPLIAVAALMGCDSRLPRPWEPTVPQKSFAAAHKYICGSHTLTHRLKVTND